MWIYLNNAFVSIVQHRDDPDVMCCRARLKGDLQKAFRGFLRGRKVKHTPAADYAYRVNLPRSVVWEAMLNWLEDATYPNFKGSVRDPAREALYLRVWSVMKAEQDKREGRSATGSLFAPQFWPARIPTRNADGLLVCGQCDYEEANGALLAQCSACEHEQELADLEEAEASR